MSARACASGVRADARHYLTSRQVEAARADLLKFATQAVREAALPAIRATAPMTREVEEIPAFPARLSNRPRRVDPQRKYHLPLRQRQVAVGIWAGLKGSEIAKHLALSASAVGQHQRALFAKLNVRTAYEFREVMASNRAALEGGLQ